jgi:hypothetical protein
MRPKLLELIESLVSKPVELLVPVSQLFIELNCQLLNFLLVGFAVVNNSFDFSVGLFSFLFLFLGLGLKILLYCAHLGDNFIPELRDKLRDLRYVSLADKGMLKVVNLSEICFLGEVEV